jgi:hypothetical protein
MEGIWSTALAQGVPAIEVTARLGEPITYVASVSAGPVDTPAMPPAARPQRRRSALRQGDVKRAMKAAQDAGVPISKVSISPDGTITLVPGAPTPAAPEDNNPWDRP